MRFAPNPVLDGSVMFAPFNTFEKIYWGDRRTDRISTVQVGKMDGPVLVRVRLTPIVCSRPWLPSFFRSVFPPLDSECLLMLIIFVQRCVDS